MVDRVWIAGGFGQYLDIERAVMIRLLPGRRGGVRIMADSRETHKNEKVREIEEKLADLKGRWPAHSVPPSMWQQLEKLESELEEVKK